MHNEQRKLISVASLPQ